MSEHDIGLFTKLPAGVVVAGRYEILGFLGTGDGFAPAYRALDRETGAHVALKLLPCHPDASELRESFLEEAQRLAAFEHRSVAKLLDFGLWGEAQQPYLVMELWEGEDLRVFLQGEALRPSRVLSLVRQVLEGLSSLHAAGIAHKALRPSHILCVGAGQGGEQVKIVGFCLIFQALSWYSDVRLNGFHVDVYDIERAKGVYYRLFKHEKSVFTHHDTKVDYFGSDVYSMGRILVELMRGAPLRKEGEDFFTHMCSFVMGDIYLSGALLDCGLGSVLRSALAEEREERFPDARAFLEALEGLDAASLDDVDPAAPLKRLFEEVPATEASPERWFGEITARVGDFVYARFWLVLIAAMLIFIFVFVFIFCV